jgi:hypothetical protein
MEIDSAFAASLAALQRQEHGSKTDSVPGAVSESYRGKTLLKPCDRSLFLPRSLEASTDLADVRKQVSMGNTRLANFHFAEEDVAIFWHLDLLQFGKLPRFDPTQLVLRFVHRSAICRLRAVQIKVRVQPSGGEHSMSLLRC